MEINYPEHDYKSNSKSKFIYENSDFILGGLGSSDDKRLLSAYKDNTAILLSKGMERVKEDIALLLAQNEVEEGESNTYSHSLIPFNMDELMYYKNSRANTSLNDFHTKLEGNCQKKPTLTTLLKSFLN